ncbi:MAG: hypothetical protein IJ039_04170 [Clostridia bacterium]|nr:hypothetical protein [Clostridia bacterium]
MESPLITMSAITGKPTQKEIYNYLKNLKENGIDSALLYPRSGCEIEYLSKEWFNTVEGFINSATVLDMKLWLYDDFNWPSGDAGGRVSANEPYRLRAIKLSGIEKGKITYKSHHNSGLFGEKYFPNLLSEEAVDYFIKCTHEEYYKRFAKHFGTVIRGMFTDEPSIGYCCESDSVPYYEGIEQDYNNAFNRDFHTDLLCEHKELYSNVIELVSNRFNKCYISKLSSWCKEHGILMTGHLMCDNDPIGATKHAGHFLKNLSTFMLPGIDEIATCPYDISEMTLLGACEYASGENGAMAELFALGPCDLTYKKRICILYLASAFKIDRYFLAVSHMDLRGNKLITDYFNNFNIDQPDFSGMKLFSMEAKKAALLAKSDFTPDVYIRYPFKQCIDIIRKKGWGEAFMQMINELSYKGIQWKYIDDEIIENVPVIEVDNDFKFTVDNKEFDTTSIKGSVTIEAADKKEVKGIFVRKYNDGSTLVINLFAPKGEYIINGNALKLDTYSVLLLEDGQREEKREEIKLNFDVHYCNDNVIRTMHLNGEKSCEIYAKCDTGVTICVRNDENALLNGEKIPCQNQARMLPNGMQSLYKMSDPITLKAGVNVITASNDIKYLPTVLLCGAFSYQLKSDKICKITLEKRKNRHSPGEKLYDYGKIQLSARVKIPKGAKQIKLQGTDLYTKVYIDDALIGEKISSPYVFNLDSSLWNKEVTLKIEQHSSMGAIFGDIEYWDKNVEKSGWRGTPSPSPHPFGIETLYWIF